MDATSAPEHPDKLYKYCGPARADILEGLKIRFTQPTLLNDIFESFPAAGAPVDRSADGYNYAIWLHQKHPEGHPPYRDIVEVRRIEKEWYREFHRASEADLKLSMEMFCQESQTRMSAVSGILCLSATWDNILMWAHYCDNHRGFSLELDGTHKHFLGMVRVIYSNVRPLMQPDANGMGDPSVFFTKSMDWEYEQEYRKFANFGSGVLLPNGNLFTEFPQLKDITEEHWTIRLLDLAPEIIHKVVLGHRVTPETVKRVLKALENPLLSHVTCTQARPHSHEFKMKEEPLKR